ncbi:hypothetical protein [Senegalia massiliensis]|uniref:Uncharacterized protein n=1 Tax=Senegalia massiliensis TaxID=1720316 RepID=A0A845R5I7_9CLOT|nr:hypothetical protein [Senegalia massiliensis]NBI07773.1 hypothetical protein [Senegalia massiliensis]
MIRTIRQISNIQFSISINAFLYFLKKIPLIKNLLKNINYSFMKFKSILSVLSIIWSFVSTPIKTAVSFLLPIFLPAFLIFDGDINININAIFSLILSFYFILAFVFSNTLSTDKEKFILIKQMRMPPKEYFISKIFFEETIKFLGKIIFFYIFFKFLNFNFLFGIKLSLMISSINIISEALYLFLFNKRQFNVNSKPIIQVIIYAIIVIVSYLISFLFMPKLYFSFVYFFFTNNIPFLITLTLGILSSIYIYKYENFWDVINSQNTIEDFKELNEVYKEANFVGIKLDEKDYSTDDLKSSKFNNKEGYDYLNSIFFERHKKTIYRPMLIKSAIIILGFIAILVLNIFIDDIPEKELIDMIINKYTLFVFIIYLLSNSENIIKSLFYNCDISLLKYSFYKQGDALLKMFFLRLKKIIYSNIIPILILCLGLLIITFIYDSSRIIDIIPILIFIIVLNLFFSIHYIFMYYIFQPYTTDLKVKNPFFKIINFAVYFISYMSLQIDAPAKIFLPITIAISIIYILIAITLVYKKSPETFKTK